MKKMILACGAALSIATMANATLIRYVAEWDMVKTDGLDSLGLDGAHFVFTADFDSADVYGDNGFGFPQANASADSLTITGSTGGDGTYSSLFGVAFTPATRRSGSWRPSRDIHVARERLEEGGVGLERIDRRLAQHP